MYGLYFLFCVCNFSSKKCFCIILGGVCTGGCRTILEYYYVWSRSCNAPRSWKNYTPEIDAKWMPKLAVPYWKRSYSYSFFDSDFNDTRKTIPLCGVLRLWSCYPHYENRPFLPSLERKLVKLLYHHVCSVVPNLVRKRNKKSRQNICFCFFLATLWYWIDIGERFGARMMYFHTKWWAKEPQNPQNHRIG